MSLYDQRPLYTDLIDINTMNYIDTTIPWLFSFWYVRQSLIYIFHIHIKSSIFLRGAVTDSETKYLRISLPS